MEINDNLSDVILEFRDFSLYRAEKKICSLATWLWQKGEQWVLSGDNLSGADALAQRIFSPVPGDDETGFARIAIHPSRIRLVSFGTASSLMAYERTHDDSDFVEGGVDPGRTAYGYLVEKTGLSLSQIKQNPTAADCGVHPFGNRGIKYLSTGETRRLLLCEALASRTELLILEDPFDGVDSEGRTRIRSLLEAYIDEGGSLLLAMERLETLPRGLTHALELRGREQAFTGTLADYAERYERERTEDILREKEERSLVEQTLASLIPGESRNAGVAPLVEMKNVTVEWSGRKVLDSLDWKLERGRHWLIRGPNGSGKTTFLELITGDNPQVYRNDVRLFGRKRGSGETIWEIKERMGIVSYKMHLEFRLIGDLDVESVILSGFHDSIGLYRQKGEEETLKARAWLELGGFTGRETERFSTLSYGDQRAVLILRGVVKSPEILILDEPCHGLDERHRLRVLDLLEAIGRSGNTTLLHVTHDPAETLPCEKSILELRPGETPMYRTIHL